MTVSTSGLLEVVQLSEDGTETSKTKSQEERSECHGFKFGIIESGEHFDGDIVIVLNGILVIRSSAILNTLLL